MVEGDSRLLSNIAETWAAGLSINNLKTEGQQ
jgi:hypothetical protein